MSHHANEVSYSGSEEGEVQSLVGNTWQPWASVTSEWGRLNSFYFFTFLKVKTGMPVANSGLKRPRTLKQGVTLVNTNTCRGSFMVTQSRTKGPRTYMVASNFLKRV